MHIKENLTHLKNKVMTTFKKCKVLLLPTNEKSAINFVFNTAYKKILSFKDSFSDNITFGEYQHLYILSDEKIKDGDWFINLEVKGLYRAHSESDHGINNLYKYIFKKIIATTDKSLSLTCTCGAVKVVNTGLCPECHRFINIPLLPQPSQAFIEKYVSEYNKGNIITDVLVEYEIRKYDSVRNVINSEGDYFHDLKISKDNNITIKKVKDSWTREELPIDIMLNLIGHIDTPIGRRKYHSDVVEQIQLLKKWMVEQNL